ncbi:MAG: hypothetical protein IKJ26_03045 [Clostridia bacterium]|nr:hypothetical protein [Clostridia bacterium]
MYQLQNGNTFLRLSDDLQLLEYGRGALCRSAKSPFQFSWTGIPITVDNISQKNVTATESEICIDFAGFRFAARFPGNTYCRPNPEYTPDLRIRITLRLDGDDLVITSSPIENIDKGECRLQVLLAQGLMQSSTQSEAQLYLPIHYGMRFDCPRNDIFTHTYAASAGWTLPIHGLFTPEGGIGLWCDDPDRDYVVSCNTDRAGTIGVQCRELYEEMANEPRQMRFMLFDAGADFRQLALRCRELRIASGRFKTLKQKAETHPVVAELPGTVFWKHNVFFHDRPEGIEKTYSLYVGRSGWNENEGLPNNWTAEEVFGTAKERGFDRVAVCNTGWNRYGFDAGYPTRLPVNPERGTAEEFHAAANAAREMSPGYFLNVHDNYIDAYQGEEYRDDEMLQKLAGTPDIAGIWRGGQAHTMCPTCGLKYARRDIPRIAEMSGPSCMYIDVSATWPLSICRSKDHPLTRRQFCETNRELFSFARDQVGALAVEACGTDHYADVIDIGAYGGLHFTGFPARADGPVPVPVPMWQIVYHDCVLNYFGEGYSPVHGSEYRLYQALFTLLPTSFDDHAKRISFELRSAYTAVMTNFEEITPRTVTIDEDGSFHTHGIVRSTYDDGTEVVANFNEEPYEFEGETIPARDFIVRKH